MSTHPHQSSRIPQRPRVVFVMGAGRSGSTVLDLFLGQHPLVQSAGELCNFVHDGWIERRLCSCGQRISECELWSRVTEIWKKRSQVDLETYEELRCRVEHRRSVLWQMFSRPSPEQVHLGKDVRGNFLTYAQWTAGLYQAICEVTEKSVIVDSSKNAARGLALVLMAERLDLIELHLVHLVRDVRGFAWSAKKSFPADERAGIPQDIQGLPAWRSAVAWVFVNGIADFVRRRHETSRSLVLRYEDFVSAPAPVVLQLAGFIAIPPGPWMEVLRSEKPLEPGHIVAGNRLRMQRHIRLRPDVEWQSKLSFAEKMLIWLLAGWKARSYGYRYRPVSGLDHFAPVMSSASGHPLAGPHFLLSRDQQSTESSPVSESAQP
ncbi:sulfotransferase [Thermogutta sp.]|uniref:sulfotransferase n=1 Tax=Thermogutta sp. TaxID=1962930 RepID=UPI00321FB0A3